MASGVPKTTLIAFRYSSKVLKIARPQPELSFTEAQSLSLCREPLFLESLTLIIPMIVAFYYFQLTAVLIASVIASPTSATSANR